MISTKQRAHLRSLANSINVLVHIGKDGITPAVIEQLESVIYAHELVKCSILQSCETSPKEAVAIVAEKINCDIVQVIGRKFVVYKPNPDEPVIVI